MHLSTLFAAVAHAQTQPAATTTTSASNFSLDSFNFLNPIAPGANPVATVSGLLGTVIGLFLTVAAIAAFIYMLLGGMKYITSGGDSAKAEEGRKSITNALIGIVIILVSYVVVRFVATSIF